MNKVKSRATQAEPEKPKDIELTKVSDLKMYVKCELAFWITSQNIGGLHKKAKCSNKMAAKSDRFVDQFVNPVGFIKMSMAMLSASIMIKVNENRLWN